MSNAATKIISLYPGLNLTQIFIVVLFAVLIVFGIIALYLIHEVR
jgi:hypothetical protein